MMKMEESHQDYAISRIEEHEEKERRLSIKQRDYYNEFRQRAGLGPIEFMTKRHIYQARFPERKTTR